MTSALPLPVGTGAGLVLQLTARLRPEFAGDVILVGADDPVLGGPTCAVPDCILVAILVGLCSGHQKRWLGAGRPSLVEWAARQSSAPKGRSPLATCMAPACGRGRKEAGLCQTHVLRWKRAGRPELESWVAGDSGRPLEPRPPCRVGGCELHQESSVGLCNNHRSRWNRLGRPDIGTFLIDCATFGLDRFDLRGLPAPLRAEFQYALQVRADERRTKTRPDQLRRLIIALEASGAGSLLERSTDAWLVDLGLASNRRHVARRFVIDAVAAVEDVRDGVGWEVEYPRDLWRLRRLGYDVRDKTMRFDGIEAEWLRQLTKRWARWRLSTGVGLDTVMSDVRSVVMFAERCPPLRRGPAALTREQLERHLAHLAQRYPDAKTRGVHLSALAGLLRAARQHDWEPQLPTTALVYGEDYPRRDAPAPRALSETVMVQLESAANLARFDDAGDRLLAQILMGTGLRVGDGAQLAVDCVVRDADGAPYLRYRNHKMRRDAFVPIAAELAEAIAARQAVIVERHATGRCLFPRPLRNPDGVLPYCTDTFRRRLARWLLRCDVRDELGRPVHVTPHQWRHTYGTRLINSDVPQEVVRRLLDHASHSMTARYARLSDRTIRARWEAAHKVNVHGDEVAVEKGPLADAAWMKNNLARAKMALPNGFCALPIQQHCEYANACLTCAMFVTTVEFLPDHHRQLEATRELIAGAEERGQQRLAEMNRTVEANLVSIIGALEQPGCTEDCSCSGVADGADPSRAADAS